VENKKIGLIVFNSDVTIYGDGKQQPLVITGDRLNNYEELVLIGETFQLERTIKDSKGDLEKKLWELEENGQTGLGPALLLAISIAGQKPGSQVMLCTDGLANIGVGAIENLSENDLGEMYTRIAQDAKKRGVVVSIISITGSGCSLETLGIVTDQTNGNVDRVDPLSLSKNFRSCLSEVLLATNSTATVYLQEGLCFLDENVQGNILHKEIGNITADTIYTFYYGFPEKEKNSQDNKEVKIETNQDKVQFQVQVFFTQLDGRRMMRVFTTNLEVTNNRKIAEQNANLQVISLCSAQKSAEYAYQGDYKRAQLHNRANQRLMVRNLKTDSDSVVYNRWLLNNENMDREIRSVTVQESENDRSSEKRKCHRRENDNLSNILYSNKRGRDFMFDHRDEDLNDRDDDVDD